MWATSLTTVLPYFPGGTKPTKHRPVSDFPMNAPANSRLPLQPAASNGGDNPKQEELKEISGSDVLWALQRAATQKKTAKRKKKRLASSEGSHGEKDGIDYSNVRPLEIKSEWSLKLYELGKRLQELQDTT